MAELDKVLKAAVGAKASDVHLSPGEPFIVRQFGKLRKLKSNPVTPELCRNLLFQVLTDDQKDRLKADLQLDFAYEIEGLGRFRGSAMMHQRGLSAAFRIIPPRIPTLEELGLPDVINKVLDNHQGLILVTGATGQGKSTTLAAMVDQVNSNRAHHILTVEDPIEFIHPLKKGVVNQRQLGKDTLSYGNALRGALREDPDVIMIGELRDLETISLAISAAETGHLVLGTLSTSNAPKTVDRIIDSFPAGEQSQVRAMVSESLKAIITQRLIPSSDRKRRVLALEILIGTLPMANLIREGKAHQIPSMMQMGKKDGMRNMDDSIMALLKEKKITAKDAYSNAENKKMFKGLLASENRPPAGAPGGALNKEAKAA